MRQKWHVRRGFVKIHITCDRKTHRITSVEVTDEHKADTKEFEVSGRDGTQEKGEGRVWWF